MKPDHVGREDLSSAALAHDRARRHHVNGSSGLGPATDRRPATIVGGGIAGEEAGGTAVTEAATGESLARCLRELVQHTAVYGLGPVLGQVAAVLLLPLYTNLLLPADYGTLEIIVLVGVFMNVFVGLQTATQVLRSYHACECEHDRREAIFVVVGEGRDQPNIHRASRGLMGTVAASACAAVQAAFLDAGPCRRRQ